MVFQHSFYSLYKNHSTKPTRFFLQWHDILLSILMFGNIHETGLIFYSSYKQPFLLQTLRFLSCGGNLVFGNYISIPKASPYIFRWNNFTLFFFKSGVDFVACLAYASPCEGPHYYKPVLWITNAVMAAVLRLINTFLPVRIENLSALYTLFADYDFSFQVFALWTGICSAGGPKED